MIPTIEVIVSPAGETRIQSKGFAGSSCRAATVALEQALGLRQVETLTAEFYAQQTTEQPLTEGHQR